MSATITEKQIDFIQSLCHQTGNDIPQYLDIMDRADASEMIGNLIKIRDASGSAKAPAPKAPAAPSHEYDSPVIPGGYYTVVDDEGHRTFRVSPNQKWANGKTVIAVMTGPSNEFSYTGIGFVTNTGVQVWQSAKGKVLGFDRVERLVAQLQDDVEGAKQMTITLAKTYLSTNCFACGKLLTDPTSIEMGIGPVCRGDA